MNEETITITTESVKVSELQGREKQIYEYAYKKGWDNAINENLENKGRIAFGVIIVLVVIIFGSIFIWGMP